MPEKRWNTEKVKEFVEINSNAKLISEYKNWDTLIELQCVCGNPFATYIQHIKNGKLQCNVCGRKRLYKKISISYSQIKLEIESLTNSSLLTMEEEFDHQVSVFKKSPSSVGLKVLCPQCKKENITGTFNKIKKMKDFFCVPCYRLNKQKEMYLKIKKFVEEESVSGCTLISTEYHGKSDKLHFQCSCGNNFHTTWNKFSYYDKRRCNLCSEAIRKKSLSKYDFSYVKKHFESKGCLLLASEKDYSKVKDILWVVGSCNHMFQISFKEFLKRKNSECPECLAVDWDIKKVRDWVKQNMIEFKLKSRKYFTQDHLLSFICPYGHEYEKAWNSTLQGGRCTICSSSSGEQMVYAFLKRNRIKHKHQYYIDDCRDKKPLPFDYAVFYRNGRIKALIEVDGEQHEKPHTFGLSKEEAIKEFRIRKKHDNMKNEYCRKNHIRLIRIPYKKWGQMNDILSKELLEV